MKKLILFFALAMFMGCPISKAETGDVEALAKVLSESYGAEVKAEISDDKCEITFPATTIEEEVTEYTTPEKPDEEPQPVTKTVTTDVSATNAACKKIEDFNNHAQYHISHTSPQKVIAQFYNNFKFAFIKDVDIKSFSEELDIVPDMEFVRASNLHIGDASYTQKDETTGLKSEIANMKDYKLKQEIVQEDNKVKYRVEMLMDMLNIATPFASVQVKSEQQVSEFEYKISEGTPFDYNELTNDIAQLLSAKSHVGVNDVKISVDMFGVGAGFDIDVSNATLRNEKEQFDSSGSLAFKNISYIGDMISKEKQAKSIDFKYSLKNIPVESLVSISQLQKEKLEKVLAEQEKEDDAETTVITEDSAEDDAYDAKMAEILDKAAETAEFVASADVEFENAAINVELVARRKDKYLSGVSKVKVTNLYNIFPEQKQCLNNPKADEIPECSDMMFESLKEHIDVSKDTSETVYTFSDKGIFKNGEKIGDPVELDFQKMHQEKLQKDKEREEMMRQMMEEQASDQEEK